MRPLRFVSVFLVLSMVAAVAGVDDLPAMAQSVEETEEDAEKARERADVADALVDEAVENREEIEILLAETIARLSELTAELSEVGANLDKLTGQISFAEAESVSIEAAIESQAISAYMKVLSSPTAAIVASRSVEEALIASSVVEGVVAEGRSSIDALVIRRHALEGLRAAFLSDQEEFASLQEAVETEVEQLAALYEAADQSVADAIREAQAADAEHRAALDAVEVAKAREEERRRQAARATTTTTAPSSSPPTTGADGYKSGPWNHPSSVERWRGLVEQFFPADRVEQALRIINCESNGDPNAMNPYSGAAGLFQFIPSTWATTAPKAGYPNSSPYEPEPNTASAAWLANRYIDLGLPYWMAWSCKRVLY